MFWLGKKFIGAIFSAMIFLGAISAHAGQIANVDYIVQYVKQKWDMDVPYNSSQAKWAANMEYLLGVVDYVNEKLNGERTNYSATEYATKVAVDTVATQYAVNTLIRSFNCPENNFCFVPETDSTKFSFDINIAGTLYVDWGDGNKDVINQTGNNASSATVTHTYTDGKGANQHFISLDGNVTGYTQSAFNAAISFKKNPIKAMKGCLGCVFPTLGYGDEDNLQPAFYQTFMNNTALTGPIPENLFDGISGPPKQAMFWGTFSGCTSLSGSIPANLFAELSGAPSQYLFVDLFKNCSGLTGTIPANLFAGIEGEATGKEAFEGIFDGCSGLTGSIPSGLFSGISGEPKAYMFMRTFAGCSGLTGGIPAKLFAGLSGTPITGMFYETFKDCSGLTGIGDGLIGDIDGTVGVDTFRSMFQGCTSLTGPSATVGTGSNKQYLYKRWSGNSNNAFTDIYNGATGLSDYSAIPNAWK